MLTEEEPPLGASVVEQPVATGAVLKTEVLALIQATG